MTQSSNADTAPDENRESVAPGACVLVLEGDGPGRRIPFDRSLTLGRGVESDLLIADSKVSRRHARIQLDEARREWVLMDLDSSNGTFVDGLPIRRTALPFGARVQVGGTLLLFTHHDRLEERLHRKRKLEALGRMGAGIAHDFNNLLAVIQSSVRYLDELPKDTRLGDRDAEACRKDIETAAKQATELTQRLMYFAKGRRVPMEAMDAGDLVREAESLLARSVEPRIRVECHVERGLSILGDWSQLSQAVMNLCMNARDAMAESGGTLRLDVGLDHGSAGVPALGSPHVFIRVADDGVGMDATTRDRLFEPFFTTKGDRGGTGLGLANVFDTVTSHGGTIEVDTTPGRGSVFTIRLPSLQTAQRPVTQVPHRTARRLVVLVADDEPRLRRTLCRVIEQLGHRTLEVENGEEALEKLRTHPAVDLVVLDLDMPVMGGDECFEEIRARRPDLPVVFASASLDDQRRHDLLRAGAEAVLAKPVQRAELTQVVTGLSDRLDAMHSTSLFEVVKTR